MTSSPTVVLGFSGEATIRQAEGLAERFKQALVQRMVLVERLGVQEDRPASALPFPARADAALLLLPRAAGPAKDRSGRAEGPRP